MSGLMQFAGRSIRDILSKYGVEDEALAQELVDAAFKVRAFQPEGGAQRRGVHPALSLCAELTGREVPDILRAEVIALWDETPDEKLWRSAWADWNRNGKDPRAWTWTKWARAKKDGNGKAIIYGNTARRTETAGEAAELARRLSGR